MKSDKKICIRPANVGNLILLLIAALFLIGAIGLLSTILFNTSISIRLRIFYLSLIVFASWFGALTLFIAMTPKITFLPASLEIVHWKDGLPYSPKNRRLLRLPKTRKTTINYKDIQLYGSFLTKDINEYLHWRSGLLSKYWIAAIDAPIPDPIKMQKPAAGLRSVFLVVNHTGNGIVIDAEAYGSSQIEHVLFELEKRTCIHASGHTKPKRHNFNYLLETSKSVMIILWLFAIPVSMVWLEGIFNPGHAPDYQSVWRHIYLISMILANICVVGHIASRRQNGDVDVQKIRRIFRIAALALYPLFLIAFTISVII